MSHDDGGQPRGAGREEAQISHDAIGAYLLDALPPVERQEFERHLVSCPACQRELADLKPVATLLPHLFQHLTETDSDETVPFAPAGEVKDRIIASVSDDEMADSLIASSETRVDEPEPSIADGVIASTEDEPEATAPATVDDSVMQATEDVPIPQQPRQIGRPRGRVSPGLAGRTGGAAGGVSRNRRLAIPLALAAAAAIVAIGAILWALAMMGQVNDLKDERDFQNKQLAELTSEREEYLAQTPAIVFTLASTTLGADQSSATVFVDPSGERAILTVNGLQELPADRTYQLWYIKDGKPEPGQLFRTDSQGSALIQIDGDVTKFQALAVTQEPSAGSEAPTSDPIIQGLTA